MHGIDAEHANSGLTGSAASAAWDWRVVVLGCTPAPAPVLPGAGMIGALNLQSSAGAGLIQAERQGGVIHWAEVVPAPGQAVRACSRTWHARCAAVRSARPSVMPTASAHAPACSALAATGVNRIDGVTSLQVERGNSAAYLVARLKRDAPEIAERLAAGEFRSARAAGAPRR